MAAPDPPPAAGQRLEWEQLPPALRATVEARLGARIVAAITQPSGFSPGVAVRLRLANGQRAFVKAVGPWPNPHAAGAHRREAAIVAALPPAVPVPRLLWSHDEGEGGWVVLAFEEVDGRHPAQPWRADELQRVLTTLQELATQLTPAPARGAAWRPAAEWYVVQHPSWRLLRDEWSAHAGQLDAWSTRHLDALVDLAAQAPAAVTGETLLHLDVRADNLLLTPERVLLVDWPHARVGAAWVDVVFFASSVAMQGGPSPQQLLASYPPAAEADPQAVTAVVSAIAGFFTLEARLPPPPGLPTLRQFQAAQSAVARCWLAERTGWP
ncbi:MAG TPA: aminoglycoside phosphotransferase family protein [Chloroflexota bacterium]|nr:aminoglycoside phosphotransferase family protein [Chloroflexota bacterium]